MHRGILEIIMYLKEQRGFDFSGSQSEFIERNLENRLAQTQIQDITTYVSFLKEHQEEQKSLIDLLNIKVSHFFRHPLTFEFLADMILPALAANKQKIPDPSLRVWSAGCAHGEEVYSCAILLNEFLSSLQQEFELYLFATDIDKKALCKAKEGCYDPENIKNVKYGFIRKYFQDRNGTYYISPELKNRVQFSLFDLLNNKAYIPPESIYGNFDLVFCRNVLIYYIPSFQEIIFTKLYRSLNQGGYLVLGQVELPPRQYANKLKRITGCCKIYQKKGNHKK